MPGFFMPARSPWKQCKPASLASKRSTIPHCNAVNSKPLDAYWYSCSAIYLGYSPPVKILVFKIYRVVVASIDGQ